jgi:hypothetical protein
MSSSRTFPNDLVLGALMRDSEILVANDVNTHRLGLTNTMVTKLDGRSFSEVGNEFLRS